MNSTLAPAAAPTTGAAPAGHDTDLAALHLALTRLEAHNPTNPQPPDPSPPPPIPAPWTTSN